MQSLIDRAIDAGIDKSKYSKLQRIISSTKTNNGKTFNTNVESWWTVAGKSLIPLCYGYLGNLFDPITYNEVIDEEMKKLHAEIITKEAQQDQEGQQA